jgi:chromosome segregation ATPase
VSIDTTIDAAPETFDVQTELAGVDRRLAETEELLASYRDRLQEVAEEARRYHARCDELTGDLNQARTEKQQAEDNLQRFKDRVVDVGGQAAEQHEWCGVYDEIMEKLGLPRREREFEVRVRVSYDTTVTLMATSDEDAEERIGSTEVLCGWRPGCPLEGMSASGYASDVSVETL